MLINGFTSFLKISILVNLLGSEYNGLNNLYTQIFSFIMIGEAGLGLATTSALYSPIAEHDYSKVNKIVSGSRTVLTKLLLLLLIGSIIISFFIPFFIKNNKFNIYFLILTFNLFAMKALVPQWLQPFKGYIAAKQDEYIINILRIITTIVVSFGEVWILINFKNYILMLLYGIFSTVLIEVINYFIYKKLYPEINIFNIEKDFEPSSHMKELVKVNIVSTVAKSIDPVIISQNIGLIFTSLYSNYSYVQNFLMSLIGILLNGFTHIFGEIFAKKEIGMKEKFDKFIIFTNFIASICSVVFLLCIQKFVSLWINSDNLLDYFSILLFSILIYMYLIMRPMNILVITNKYFNLASNSSLYETVLNIVISLVLIKNIGIAGVLLGSIISYLIASFWYFPVNTYKSIFNYSARDYFKKQYISFILLIILIILSNYLVSYIYYSSSWIYFIIYSLVIGIVVLLLNTVFYIFCFKEFRGILSTIKDRLKH